MTEIPATVPALCLCRSFVTPTTSVIIVVIVIVTNTIIVTRDKSASSDKSKRAAAQRPLPTIPPIQFEITKK